MRHVETIDPFTTGAHWLFGARTLLVDRAVAAVERMWLPPASSPGGTITITHGGVGNRLPATRHGLRALRQRLRGDPPIGPLAGPLVDMRARSPQNFSHALVIHLPQCELVRSVIGPDFTVVLPADTPSYIRNVFALAGFSIATTDRAVPGDVCRVELSELECLKGAVGLLARDLAARMRATPPAEPAALPKRVFLARRGTRAIANQREIEALLEPLGYVTCYAEDLSVPDQFRLFDEAEQVVGVHGAGLAPMLYRDPARAPLRLVEILPAAHMTNLHRFFVDTIGGRYVGVRGRITAADAAAAYRSEMYVAHSLDPFEVDPASVAIALETMAGITG